MKTPNNPPLASVRAELLPCPFCGCEASREFFAGDGYSIFCDGCHASAATETSCEAARAAWNQRAIDTATTQLLDEIEGRVKRERAEWAADTPIDTGARLALDSLSAAIQEVRHGRS